VSGQLVNEARPSRRRRWIGVAAIAVATALGLTSLPGTSVEASPKSGVQYGKDWQTGKLPRGVTKAKIDAVVSPAMGSKTNPNRVASVIVVVGDKIVYERYHPRENKTSIMGLFSASKSFTSSIIGALVDDGLLSLDTTPPIAAWSDPADPRRVVTLRHLLNMSSGLKWDELCRNCANDLNRLIASPDPAAYVASQPLEKQPNTEWEYSSGTSALLGSLIYTAAGSVAGGDTYIKARLLDPIGIKSYTPSRDASGRYLGYIGADMNSRDMARFGLLYLNRGVWGDKRVISEAWVDFVKTPSPANPEYGGHFWIYKDGGFMARGLGGQLIVISPNKKMVMVVTTKFDGLASSEAMMTKAEAVRDAIYALFPNQ